MSEKTKVEKAEKKVESNEKAKLEALFAAYRIQNPAKAATKEKEFKGKLEKL